MANYTFTADGQIKQIKLFPKDAQGNAITGITMSLINTGGGCGTASLTNIVEGTENGVPVVTADLIAPTDLPSSGTCIVRASKDGGNCDCPLEFTAQSIDCNSIVVMVENTVLAVGTNYFVDIDINDINGNPYSNQDLVFSATLATITSATYQGSGQWRLQVTHNAVGQSQIRIESTLASDCVVDGGNVVSNPVLDCAQVACSGPASGLVQGTQSEIIVRLLRTDGAPITSGAVFTFSGGTAGTAVYDAVIERWRIPVTPTANAVVLTSVTTAVGDCTGTLCTIAATSLLTIDCASLVYGVLGGGNMTVGQASTIFFTVDDSDGNPVTGNSVGLSFSDGTASNLRFLNNQWLMDIIPLDQTLNGIVTSDLGDCSNLVFGPNDIDPAGGECCPRLVNLVLPDAQVGVAYAGSIDVEGTFTVSGLPAGLVFNAATKQVTGTPASAGTSNLTVTSSASCSLSLQLVTRVADVTEACPKMESIYIPSGINGQPYSGFVSFSGIGPRTYTMTGLPAGLQLNPTTGSLSGTPSQTGNFTSVLTVEDDNGSCQYTMRFDINEEIICPEIPPVKPEYILIPRLAGKPGDVINERIIANSDNNISFTAQVIGNGLSLDSNGNITGIVQNAGEQSFTVVVTDLTTQIDCELNLTFYGCEPDVEEPKSPKVISLPSLEGTVGESVQAQIIAQSPEGNPIEFLQRSIGNGLIVNDSGQITGTINEPGENEFIITVRDTVTNEICDLTATYTTSDPTATKPSITSLPNLNGLVGETIDESIMFSSVNNVEFLVTEIGNGLFVTPSGNISGVIIREGVFEFIVTVRDLVTQNTCSLKATYISIADDECPPQIDKDTIRSLVFCMCRGKKSSVMLGASVDGWVVDGELPLGLSFLDGNLSGTPLKEGDYQFSVRPGTGDAIEVLLQIEDCLPEDLRKDPLEEISCEVRLISCVNVNGVKYDKVSYENPSNPIKVTITQRDYLLANGYAIAHPLPSSC